MFACVSALCITGPNLLVFTCYALQDPLVQLPNPLPEQYLPTPQPFAHLYVPIKLDYNFMRRDGKRWLRALVALCSRVRWYAFILNSSMIPVCHMQRPVRWGQPMHLFRPPLCTPSWIASCPSIRALILQLPQRSPLTQPPPPLSLPDQMTCCIPSCAPISSCFRYDPYYPCSSQPSWRLAGVF